MGGLHDDVKAQAVLAEVRAQRDRALDMLADACGVVAMLKVHLAEAEAALRAAREAKPE